MDELDALVLGIIQGLTEFLPVSSSGHLEIGRRLIGANQLPSDNLLMTSILHFATALSTIVVFRKEIWGLFTGILSENSNYSKNYIIKIIIAIIPAGIIGFTLNDYIEIFFALILGWIFFAEWPVDQLFPGAFFIVLGGLIIYLQQ